MIYTANVQSVVGTVYNLQFQIIDFGNLDGRTGHMCPYGDH